MPAEIKQFKGLKTVAVDPRKQYVAGGLFYAGNEGVRTLSGLPEDVTREHSAKTYDQMMSDPKVSKFINLIKISVVGETVEFRPSVSERDPDYEYAKQICDFCKAAINQLDVKLRDTLEQMLDALIYGHKIAEITYKTTNMRGFDGAKLVPDKIRVKKLDVVQFVVDDKGNTIGFSIRNPAFDNKKAVVSKGKDGRALLNGKAILPKEKFLVLTIRSKDGDPRGHSILSAAFNAWHLKTQIWPEYFRYLLLCGMPLLVGTTPENDNGVKEILRNPDGTAIIDPVTGGFIEANSVEALRDALMQARNGEVFAAKGGTKVQEIGGQGAGTPFYKAIELFDSQMETGVLLQTLATSEGLRQSRAASTMHMSVLDQLIYWFKGVVVDMLVRDLLRPMVRYNFGDDALDFIPKVTLGDTERRDFATDSVAVATLKKVGYFTPEQLRHTDEILGFEPRETITPELLIQQLQAAGVPIVAIPPQPQIAAEVQAGPDGGTTPVPLDVPKTTEGGAKTGKLPSTTAKTALGNNANARFPASGRVSNINQSPKNSQINPNITQLAVDILDEEE